MSFEQISLDTKDGLAWITVRRPKKMNALNRATVREIVEAVDRAERDDDVRILVLTGEGEKAFVAGADIGEMASLSAQDGQSWGRFLQESLDRIERCVKPVIAAVNGFALGGGCELAMACHVRIAADRAKFGQPEVNLGLIPGAGGTQRLPRLVGRGRAIDLAISGELIDAAEALRIGLVTRICAPEELTATVEKYAALLMTKSPVAQARCLEAILSGEEVSQAEAMRLEAALFGLSFATDDMREGTKAFLEKRKPEFTGR